MDLNKNSYNQIASDWAKSRNKSFLSELIIDFTNKLKLNANVLDIGCGTGYPIGAYLANRGFEITGIDFSESMIQKAIELHLPKSQFFLTDFFDFVPTRLFDGIIAFDSFFHFPYASQRLIYPKVANWLQPGGVLLFTHGLKSSEINSDMFGQPFYYSSLDKDEVIQLLESNGMEIENSIEKYVEKDMDRDWVVFCRKK